MKIVTSTYPGFQESVTSIKKFKASNDLFSIMLNDGRIIHHTAKDAVLFKKWLLDNNIEDIANKNPNNSPL
ncbi:hypothetical protein [Mucilaginibacter sp.]|uniref:hypothetical protein n=1 Tax=Mucilaginibacter sp. TaxID=1882438 RepID=UPI00374D6FAD